MYYLYVSSSIIGEYGQYLRAPVIFSSRQDAFSSFFLICSCLFQAAVIKIGSCCMSMPTIQCLASCMPMSNITPEKINQIAGDGSRIFPPFFFAQSSHTPVIT